MGNFQGGGNRGGGGYRGGDRSGNGGGRSNFGGRGGAPVTMHNAVCDECHKSCEVPFRPSGDKPIYCSDCFNKKRGSDDNRGPRRSFSDDRAPRREYNDNKGQSFNKLVPAGDDLKNSFREINVKLDRLSSAIEKLTAQKGEEKLSKKVLPIVTSKVEVKKSPVVKVISKKEIVKKVSKNKK